MSINDIVYLRGSGVDYIFDIVYSICMGRPPLNMKPALVRFPADVLERIDKLVGARNRPRFIRDAVTSELQRQEKLADGGSAESSETSGKVRTPDR